MSYDLYFFKPLDGESVDEAYERLFDESGEVGEGPITPDKESLKERLASALISSGSGLEKFQFDYASLAKSLKLSEEEARRQWRHIEINSPEDGNGIQITIEDDSASIAIPYWHQGSDARAAFEEIWGYAKVLEKEAGYVAYDPQLERPIDISSDLDEVIETYTNVSGSVESIVSGDVAESVLPEKPKPWWKFW